MKAIKEFFTRLRLPTPEFFKKWLRFFMYTMAACGLILVGEEFGGNFLQEWADWLVRTVFSCSAIGALICKLTVYDWDAERIKNDK